MAETDHIITTERAKIAIDISQEEATRHRNEFISPAHLALGILQQEDCLAVKILRELGADVEVASLLVTETLPKTTTNTVLPSFDSSAKRSIKIGLRETKRLRYHYLGTPYLLIGVVIEGQADIPELRSPTVAILEDHFRITLPEIRQETERMITGLSSNLMQPDRAVINPDVITVLHGWNLFLQNPSLSQEKRAGFVESLLRQLEEASLKLNKPN